MTLFGRFFDACQDIRLGTLALRNLTTPHDANVGRTVRALESSGLGSRAYQSTHPRPAGFDIP